MKYYCKVKLITSAGVLQLLRLEDMLNPAVRCDGAEHTASYIMIVENAQLVIVSNYVLHF